MLNMTPEAYSQVRTRNGSSWLKSSAPAPSRARLRPMPMLNTAWSARAGMASSQYQVSGSPEASTITVSTTIDMTSCSSSMITYPMGRQARGNGSARPEPVPGGQVGERLVGQGRRIYVRDHQVVGQRARTALVTCAFLHPGVPAMRRATRARGDGLTTFTDRRYRARGRYRGHRGFLLGRRYRSDIWSAQVFPERFHGAFPLVPGSLKVGQTGWGWHGGD